MSKEKKLKSTLGKFQKTRMKKSNKPVGKLLEGGVNALIGVGLLSQTADAVRRI